jgi:regulator of sigma E protease
VVVQEVLKGTPAAKAGMRPKDILIKIGGKAIANQQEAIDQIGASKGKPVNIGVRRSEQEVVLKVTPRSEGGTYRIGIMFSSDQRFTKISFLPVGVREAAIKSLVFPVIQTERALAGFGSLFAGKASVKQVGGPLKIVEQLKMSFEHSFAMAMLFLALLNVYLGLFNLLPVPALDGGRLVFLTFTIISRRPVNQRVEGMIHMVGFLLLLGLILLVSFKDVGDLFGK